jgi:hypothetical protein
VYNHNLYFKRIVKEVGVPMSQMESIASSAVSTLRLFRPGSGLHSTSLESEHTFIRKSHESYSAVDMEVGAVARVVETEMIEKGMECIENVEERNQVNKAD